MALLVKDFKLLQPDHLTAGVHHIMAMSSEIFDNIAFEQINSLTYKYNVMEELPDVEYRIINGSYTEGVADIKQTVEELCIFGGDVDVDVVLQYSSNLNDLRAIQVEAKTKALMRRFDRDFFLGDGTSNSLKGLEKRVAEGIAGTIVNGTITGEKDTAVEELQLVYEVMSKVNKCTHLFMSQSTYVKFNMMLHNAGIRLVPTVDSFGRTVEMFNRAKVVAIDDALIKADKIYAVSLDKDCIRAVTSTGLQVRDLGELATKPVFRTRIEMSIGIVTSHPKAFAILEAPSVLAKAKK